MSRKLPYLKSYRDRHGKPRHYLRVPGAAAVALPGEYGSREFIDAYWEAREQNANRERGEEKTIPYSFGALIALYYKSAGYKDLHPKTRATYRGLLERFRKEHGAKPVKGFRQRHIITILDAKTSNQTNWRKVIRLILKLAVERGWIEVHPMDGLRRPKKAKEGFRAWTWEDIAKFQEKWPTGSRERLALALLLYTGQRRSDVVGMGRQHVKDGKINVVQQKTGKRLAIRLHAALKAELDVVARDQLTFLQTQYGEPFTANGFGNWFRAAAKAAGLPARSNAHGLRKAAAVMLAEAGCTPSQIKAVTGHANLAEVTLYTEAADQERLAAEAIEMAEKRTDRLTSERPVRQNG